jgi:hypothetical protein
MEKTQLRADIETYIYREAGQDWDEVNRAADLVMQAFLAAVERAKPETKTLSDVYQHLSDSEAEDYAAGETNGYNAGIDEFLTNLKDEIGGTPSSEKHPNVILCNFCQLDVTSLTEPQRVDHLRVRHGLTPEEIKREISDRGSSSTD